MSPSLATMRAVRLSGPGPVDNLRLTTLPPPPARHGLLQRQPGLGSGLARAVLGGGGRRRAGTSASPGAGHGRGADAGRAAQAGRQGTAAGRRSVRRVIAATVIGDFRDVSRFASRDRFAAYDGTAPIEASSGNGVIHRLSLRGNRRLNHAIHMAAITQIRYQHSDGRACYDKKIAEGKTPKEALRALKRRISDAIYRGLKADAARIAAASIQGPGGHAGNDSVASAVGSHPERRLFGQATPGPVTTLRRPADQQKGPVHPAGKIARTT
jgi:transposase